MTIYPKRPILSKGNAFIWLRYVKNKYGYDCFADDTGLQVEALNGEPVYIRPVVGEPFDSEKNIDKLLANLRDAENRKAKFCYLYSFGNR